MSLLEDIFLRDEADEARELERIEGDEYDEKPQDRSDSDDNSEKEDEAEEEKKRVDPSTTKTKRAVRNPRFILNPARLTGPRGIQVIPEHFKDFKFKGKGHEKEDLDLVLKKLEHWAYRLYPKFQFEDCLKKIETLGKKRPVMVHLHKIRSDQYVTEDTVIQKESSDEESAPAEREEDEFDKLLQQQIEIARSTPAPGSLKKTSMDNSIIDRSSILAPKATSSPSISEEQKERMMRNRKLAEERRLARLKNNSDVTSSADNNTIFDTNPAEIANNNDYVYVNKKQNKSNVIDSSDEEGIRNVNESITVDVHADKSMGARQEKNRALDNGNDDFDTIVIAGNGDERTKDIHNVCKETLNEECYREIENKESEVNELGYNKYQSEHKQNNSNVNHIEFIEDSEKIADKGNLEPNELVGDDAMVSENAEKVKDIFQKTVTLENINLTKESKVNATIMHEDQNSQASAKDSNELMDVDFTEDI